MPNIMSSFAFKGPIVQKAKNWEQGKGPDDVDQLKKKAEDEQKKARKGLAYRQSVQSSQIRRQREAQQYKQRTAQERSENEYRKRIRGKGMLSALGNRRAFHGPGRNPNIRSAQMMVNEGGKSKRG